MKQTLLPILMLITMALAQAKPNVAIATFGPLDGGKTLLTSVITLELSRIGLATYLSYDMIDRSPEEKERGITVDVHKIEYETRSRHYTHFDCPGHEDFTSKTSEVLSKLENNISHEE